MEILGSSPIGKGKNFIEIREILAPPPIGKKQKKGSKFE